MFLFPFWLRQRAAAVAHIQLLCPFIATERRAGREGGGGGGGKRRSVLAERPSHMKSAMLRPYASPGGPGFQATVSKRQGHWRLNPEDFSDGGVGGNNAGHHLPAGKITWLSFWLLHKDFIHTRPLPVHADPPPGGVRWEHWHVCWILIRGDRSVSTFKTLARWLKPKQEEFCRARPTLCVFAIGTRALLQCCAALNECFTAVSKVWGH